MIKITIPLNPMTKKNGMMKTRHGLIQGKAYLKYERDCKYFIRRLDPPIDYAVNVKALYYRKTKHKVDLTNLHEALHDILIKYGVLEDDNYLIVVATDGSRVLIDKKNPRTEIEIEEV